MVYYKETPRSRAERDHTREEGGKLMRNGNEPEMLALAHCSFCGKREDSVHRITTGPGTLCICNECVDFCREKIEQGHSPFQWREWQRENVEPPAITEPIHIAYEALRRAVLEYVEGINMGDPSRIERSIHPDLRTRGFLAAREGSSSLLKLTFAELLERRDNPQQEGKMPKDAPQEMLIGDLGDQIATVKLTAWWGTDYLHLAKEQEHWMIVNILRQMHPPNSGWLDHPYENV